jgi:hypothetical protein
MELLPMKMSRAEFEAWPNKAITLLGMSGVGKTTMANKLPKTSWFHYSGDYRIGTKYLEEPILDNIKRQAMQVDFLRDLLRSDSIYICSNITVHNLVPISTFLGKVGNPSLGGLSVSEFKHRQNLHFTAEEGAMRDVADFIDKGRNIYGYEHFINDAGGSVCELTNSDSLQVLVDKTLILYIRADGGMEEEITRRAIADPKPLYYEEAFFDAQLGEYMTITGLADTKDLDPDQFVRWVFPRLLAHRRPLYQTIADRYGYVVDAKQTESVRDETDFLELVASAIEG